ncbi:MG2 domain-containing protein [uncultured Kordia sp.]|uniref:MG2 domain-containing protein n=1 Tax=uncultured Kordia sp. TaxID=507699 RepID=UPI00260A093F|nr:MG2 domain-containing protein [uncultured Kordia sp.]
MNYKTTICYLLLLSSFLSYSQLLGEVANDSLVKYPEYIATQQLKENIYIHTDKDIYEPGEDVWFKAYLLNGNTLKLSTNTEMIFVTLTQLHPDGDKTIIHEKYEAANGFANGHLFLKETLDIGRYQLAIYTKNTLESTSKEFLGVKEIQIKQSVIPKILIDAEFSETEYHRNEDIAAEIAVFSRGRAPYVNATVIAQLYNGSKKLARTRIKTNEEGIVNINFPAEKSNKATHIKLRVKYKRQEAIHRIEIPFKSMNEIQFGMYPEGGSLVANLPNTVAFKALDPSGRPVEVKGILFENGKKVQSFSAVHNGMGTFNFNPKANQTYTIKLTEPKIDSIFQVPKILPEGIKLQVDRRNEKHVHFSITRSENIPSQKVYIRAQNRGLVYWMATASLEKERVRFRLPLDKFPQGIAEVTIFDEHFQPLAERLVYANMHQKLNVILKEISRSSFTQKDKVTMKFEVTDQNKNPAIANFSMSVHDHLYADTTNDYALFPHYYLFSELKGHVYDAGYYFNPKNKKREKHLDLLLLTQGWRNYVWNKKQLSHEINTVQFDPFIKGKVFQQLANGALQNAPEATVNVTYPTYTIGVKTDITASFDLPLSAYKEAQGTELVFIPFENKNVVIQLNDPFKNIEKMTEECTFTFPENDLAIQKKKQSSYDTKFSFTETNFLDEVNLDSFSGRHRNRGSEGEFGDNYGDYVCQFNILNCRNHPTGRKPEDGQTYRLNDGRYVTYIFKKAKAESAKNSRFIKIRGLYPAKEFYSPQYDKNPDEAMFPDNRKTLFWAPNLVSNKNGEIEVSFYTSDVQTTFLGKLEGTNGNGLLGGTVFQFDVN